MAKHYISLEPFLPWRQLERPVDWAARFGRRAPLELEIGFGNGERLVRRAREHPQLNLVGLDISWPSARRCLRKIALAGLQNLLLVQADARVALRALFPQESLSRVDALFPCPWPADKHRGRRLFGLEFLRLLNSRLEPGGVFRMVTDHRRFFAWVCGQARRGDTGLELQWRLRGPGLETKYERKWLGQGQESFYELIFTKVRHLEVPEWEDEVLQAYHLESFDPDGFQCRDFPGPELVSFKNLVFDPRKRLGLLQTVVVEGDFQQAFWLEFRWQGAYWSLRPALGCGLVPTRGVRRALELAFRQAGG